MKKLVLLVAIITLFAACGKSETKVTITNQAKPIGGIKGNPYKPNYPKKPDSDIMKNYNFSVDGLNSSDVYAILVNTQLYHDRTEDGKINVININSQNQLNKIENDEKKIIYREFDEYKNIELNEKKAENINLNLLKVNEEIGIEKTFNVYRGMSLLPLQENFVLASKGARDGKTYKIWVQKDKWSKNEFKRNYVNGEIVSHISKVFFENREKSIFDILKNIYGDFWFEDSSNYREIIDGGNEINIVLSDLNSNYSGGRILGYFNPGDVYTKEFISKSNERVMFFVDLYSLSDNDGLSWDKNQYWPDTALSTVAHEFMHVINFYHKNVRYKSQTATWLSEMLALIAEDLVSNSINTEGPRGISGLDLTTTTIGDRYSRINKANESLNTPINLYDKSISYEQLSSFGLFLTRNYTQKENGLIFLRDILWSDKSDFDALQESLSKNWGENVTVEDVLMNWGKSIILSNAIYNGQEKYKLNSNSGFSVEIDNKTYKLGGINRYNYETSPFYLSETLFDPNRNNLENASIVIYELDKDVSGNKSYTISAPNYVNVELLVRDSGDRYDYNKYIEKNEF